MGIPINNLTAGAEQNTARIIDTDADKGVLTEAEVDAAKDRIAHGELALSPEGAAALQAIAGKVRGDSVDPGRPTAGGVPVSGPLAGVLSTATRPPTEAALKGQLDTLDATQREVVTKMRTLAKQRSDAAKSALVSRLTRLGYSAEIVDRVLAHFRSSPVTINFSPDKALGKTTSADDANYKIAVSRDQHLIDAFLADDRYRTQFEVGITSGSSSAYAGGSRYQWEQTIFMSGFEKQPFANLPTDLRDEAARIDQIPGLNGGGDAKTDLAEMFEARGKVIDPTLVNDLMTGMGLGPNGAIKLSALAETWRTMVSEWLAAAKLSPRDGSIDIPTLEAARSAASGDAEKRARELAVVNGLLTPDKMASLSLSVAELEPAVRELLRAKIEAGVLSAPDGRVTKATLRACYEAERKILDPLATQERKLQDLIRCLRGKTEVKLAEAGDYVRGLVDSLASAGVITVTDGRLTYAGIEPTWRRHSEAYQKAQETCLALERATYAVDRQGSLPLAGLPADTQAVLTDLVTRGLLVTTDGAIRVTAIYAAADNLRRLGQSPAHLERLLGFLRGGGLNDSSFLAPELAGKLRTVISRYFPERPYSVTVADLRTVAERTRSMTSPAELVDAINQLQPYLAGQRPKYGGSNARGSATGAAISYGSCYFVLKPEVNARITFTAGNSSGAGPEATGTAFDAAHVLASGAIDDGHVRELVDAALGTPKGGSASWGYIEAQVHGVMQFNRDVDRVVMSLQLKNTPYEDKLRRFMRNNGIKVLGWHDGAKLIGYEVVAAEPAAP
ncbi:MAG: DUF3626 domain-containing protein [Deltaproteobacteria bacterium]|nr:DUF3626 domain-containing protein [Deltaproteobacteria bacterium]